MPPSVYDWSATPGSNTSVGGVNIAEGMSPALVNDAIRMALSIIRQTFDPSLQNFLNASVQLPIANGGTGAATAATALAALGGLSSAYQNIPVITKSAAFTFADADKGSGYYYNGAAAAATINPFGTTPIAQGAVFTIVNRGTGALTVTRGSGVTLYKNGSTTSSDAVIAIGGQASVIHWGGPDEWTITGSGIS